MAITKKSAVKVSKSAPVNLTDMTYVELSKKVLDIKEEIVILKRGTLMGDVQNVRAYKFKRRELARVLTALNGKGQEEIK